MRIKTDTIKINQDSVISVQQIQSLFASNGIKVLSLDIFDTLLFRAVAKPADIFGITWERAVERKINVIQLSKTEYQKLRVEMERRSRGKKKNREILLDDIYREMPDYITCNKQQLLELELQTEQDYCYVNSEIYDLVKSAYAANVKVVLTSDMYLKRDQMISLLENSGIDCTYFDQIFISGEYECNKQNGELYQKVLERYTDVKPVKIVHIGDNKNSDVTQARGRGMQALHYDVIPDKLYSIYDYERIRHNVPLPQILSLRKKAAYREGTEKKNITAYEIGASVIGPYLSLYISWVVNRMQELGIHRIYPLMREGYLLGELLKREAIYRKIDLKVNPIYISRKVTYLPSIKCIDREEIENMIGARNLTIGEAITLMGLEKKDFQGYASYFDMLLKESHTCKFENSTLKETFINELLQPKWKNQMEQYIKKQRELLNQYLQQEIGNLKDAATIDIGFFGRIQMWMEASLHHDKIETDLTHFLAIGVTGDKVMNGIHFEGYSSTMTENQDLVTTIHRTTDVLEKLISVTEGSTIGYRKENGRIVPVKGQPVQNPILQDVFHGIYAFQEEWHTFATCKPRLAAECVRNAREALMILHRLIDMPRKSEAELFRQVEADTNFGTNYSKAVITKENMELLREKGVDYIDRCNVSYTYENTKIVWPKGLVTLQDEFYYVRKALKEKSQNEIMKAMQEVVEQVQADGIKEVALYGAGENGRQFLFICNLYGMKVNCFIDRKESLWGTMKEGVPVMGLKEAMDKGNHVYLITSLFSIDEIRSYIIEKNDQKGNLMIYSV